MMFRWTLFLLLCSIATHLQSQQLITGIVKDASNQQPISGASVFVNNTSIGTVTNSEGAFALTVNYQQFDLVVSSIGFENAVIKITTTNVA
ncbi:MAG TPA: TonB-dependent receptor, partial [Chitinophagaceae bacterium]|nr:TonB-dependent receptor [Chitinophagaceae bacterium]